MVVNATLHMRAELMEEFKVGKHSEREPDYKIKIWKEREAELAKGGEEGDVVGEQSTLGLRVREHLKMFNLKLSPRLLLKIRVRLRILLMSTRGVAHEYTSLLFLSILVELLS